jgi:glycosyltransferase involved in cell wall biosynthesis
MVAVGLMQESLPLTASARRSGHLVVVVANDKPELLEKTLASIEASSPDDAVITQVESPRELGREVELSSAAFITVVRAGEMVSHEALYTMREILESDDSVSMAHCLWLPLDENGTTSRLAHRAHRAKMKRAFPRSMDHRREFLARGNVIQSLPTFRTSSLVDNPAVWEEGVDDGLQLAAIAALSHGDAVLLHRSLSGRLPGTVTAATIGSSLHALTLSRRGLTRSSTIRLSLGVLASAATLGIRVLWRRVSEGHGRRSAIDLVPKALRSLIVRFTSDLPSAYEMAVAAVRAIPSSLLRVRVSREGEPRLAYVLWRYPILSETFIRREIDALRESGTSVDVIAFGQDEPPMADDSLSPVGPATWYGPVDTEKGRESARAYFRRKPFALAKLWLFIVRRRDSRIRSLWGDRDILFDAARLASVIEERKITHVHAPIATRHALVAFVAARLAGAWFSAEVRASELNRTVERSGLVDRLIHADFIVANSEYISRALIDARGGASLPEIHVVHEGLDLRKLRSVNAGAHPVITLLGVGRLVEPKGFIHLLSACAELRARGHRFRCEIIGGPSDPSDTVTWLMLRAAHVSLGLQDIVTFTGAVSFSDVANAYGRADIFVLPCVRARDGSHDVTPNALMEAMAMGLPVVTTATGAIPEIITEGVDGVFVEPGNPIQLAHAIEKLILDPQVRSELGRNARAKIAKSFDANANYSELAMLFDRAHSAV